MNAPTEKNTFKRPHLIIRVKKNPEQRNKFLKSITFSDRTIPNYSKNLLRNILII